MSSREQFAGWLIRHAVLVLILFVIACVGIGYFIKDFRINASADTLLTRNNQLYIQSQVISQRFSPQEFILLAYEPKDHELFSHKTFAHLTEISDKLRQLERVDAVTSILNVPLLLAMDSLQTDLNPDDWTWQSQAYSEDKMQEIFTDHPLYEDLLVNQQQSATAIQILFKEDPELGELDRQIIAIQKQALSGELSEEQKQQVEELKARAEPLQQALTRQRAQEIEKIYQLVAPYEKDANIYLGGAHVLGYQLIKIIEQDLKLFGTGIALFIGVMLYLVFRRWQFVLLPMACCGASVLLTMGLFGLLGFKTTVISSNFIALQLILTLAVCIHLIVHYRQLAKGGGESDHKSLIRQTFADKVTPCFYAGLTTSVGFASLLISNIQPVVSFGWMMIVAMAVSISVSLLLFPTLVSLFPPKSAEPGRSLLAPLLNGCLAASSHHKVLIVIVTLMITLAGGLGLARLDVENSFLNYFRESTQIRKELTYIDQQFGGSTPLDIVYRIPESERKQDLVLSAQTVQTLQKIQHLLNQYEAVGDVTSVFNFTELAKKINQGQPLTEYELNSLYELLDKSLRDRLLGSYLAVDNQQLRISTRIQDSTEGLNRAEFLQSLKTYMEKQGIAPGQIELTNLFVLYQDILSRLYKSQVQTLGVVYVALALVLLLLFRSLRLALIALLPNVLCTLLILGIMGWLAIPLDLMTITIAAIAMGIAVDDTIHFVHHYKEHVKDKGPVQAGEQTFHTVGYALLYTSIIITLGFATLCLSDFVPSIYFGLLTGLTMMLALLADLTLLPALLMRFVKKA
ncbi:efflux RND transporter permease subunit [Bowmanella dokdonensis]|uniref:MMPL family transporter n=1 Tax=Bowmanella dokdonensis TaxID=751969 RepID=A0A939DMC7_9ALTE|nr:efflux RND transporter permease subunit [Bowmanella dokdonensis]MBN7825128.1 MMPL family transporter [Bowmanella dokdonensis]